MQLDDGGPAFPRPRGYHPTPVPGDPSLCEQEGMSLRDFYAVHVRLPDEMHPGLISAAAGRECPAPLSNVSKWTVADHLAVQQWYADGAATLRFMQADAMLAARRKTPPPPEPSDGTPERAG